LHVIERGDVIIIYALGLTCEGQFDLRQMPHSYMRRSNRTNTCIQPQPCEECARIWQSLDKSFTTSANTLKTHSIIHVNFNQQEIKDKT
jgi:hypothetical protein